MEPRYCDVSAEHGTQLCGVSWARLPTQLAQQYHYGSLLQQGGTVTQQLLCHLLVICSLAHAQDTLPEGTHLFIGSGEPM